MVYRRSAAATVAAWLVVWGLTCGLALATCGGGLPAVVTHPARPLLGTPFVATLTSAANASEHIYLSRRSDCRGSALQPTQCTSACASSGVGVHVVTCSVTVTAATLDIDTTDAVHPPVVIPRLFWCHSAGGGTPVGTLQLHHTPPRAAHVLDNNSRLLTLDAATPAGSVGVTAASSTDTATSGDRPALVAAQHRRRTDAPPSARTLHGHLHPPNIPNQRTGAMVHPTDTVRPRRASVLGGPPAAATTAAAPAYSLWPTIMYAGVLTDVYAVVDGDLEVPDTLELAVFTSANCSEETRVLPWAWVRALWGLAKVGTYHACMRWTASSADVFYVAAVAVVGRPTMRASPGTFARGMSFTAAILGSEVAGATYRVGLSASRVCTTLIVTATTGIDGAPVAMVAPYDAAEQVHLCMSPPQLGDAPSPQNPPPTSFVFAGTVTTRAYRLGYDVLRTNTATLINLDRSAAIVAGTSIAFVRADADGNVPCGAAPAGVSHGVSDPQWLVWFDGLPAATLTLPAVTFVVAGVWRMCVRDGCCRGNGGGAYRLLRELQVYRDVVRVSPQIVLADSSTEVTMTELPHSAMVWVVQEEVGCSDAAQSVVRGVTSAEGLLSLTIPPTGVGWLAVCAAYLGESLTGSSAAVVAARQAARLQSAFAAVTPTIVRANASAVLRFLNVADIDLSHHEAHLFEDAQRCPDMDGAVPVVRAPIYSATPVAAGAWAASVGAGRFQPARLYAVCLAGPGWTRYASAGVVASVTGMRATTNPSPPVAGLPMDLTVALDGLDAGTPLLYVLVHDTQTCGADLRDAVVLKRGRVTAETPDTVVVPPGAAGLASLRVCVALHNEGQSESLGYQSATEFSPVHFDAETTVLEQGRANGVRAGPMRRGATLTLVPCSGDGACDAAKADQRCAADHGWPTWASGELAAPLGRYLLCQRVESDAGVWIVGSARLVQVVQPFVLTLSSDPSALRVAVPFSLGLSGGTTGGDTGAAYAVDVVAESWSPPTRIQLHATQAVATLAQLPPWRRLRFILHADGVPERVLLEGFLLPYTMPDTLVSGAVNTLVSGNTSAGVQAKLSTVASCDDAAPGMSLRPVIDGRVSFTMESCDGAALYDVLYYCEQIAAASPWFTSRGTTTVLRRRLCSPEHPASIAAVTALPGAAITDFGVSGVHLTEPRLSRTADCASLEDGARVSTGYHPVLGEVVEFHVCARRRGVPDELFTTELPSLRVANWAATPSAVVSRHHAAAAVTPEAVLRLRPPAPSSQTYLSMAADCRTSAATASELGSPEAAMKYALVNVNGLVYVCTVDASRGVFVAVAQFLSITPPTVVAAPLGVVRGEPYRVALVVRTGDPPLYSMVAGADVEFTYHALYANKSRAVFLSTDKCAGVLEGTAPANVSADGVASFDTQNIGPVLRLDVCATTPAGAVAALVDVEVAPRDVLPTQLVAGSRATVFVRSYRGATFNLVPLTCRSSECAAAMPRFTTNDTGYATFDVTTSAGAVLPNGVYDVCTDVNGTVLECVGTVRVTGPLFFDVRGAFVVVGVPISMRLLQDLRTSHLLPGFSTTPDCTTPSTRYGAWAAVSTTEIEVTAAAPYPREMYLCAQVPTNNSLAALPSAGAVGLRFVASTVSSASSPSGWSACTSHRIDRCLPPYRADARDTDVLAIVDGGCCSDGRPRAAVLAQTSMEGGVCELLLDQETFARRPAATDLHLCAWSTVNDSECATLGVIGVATNCTRSEPRELSRGAVAGIVVGSVGGVLLLVALVVWLVCRRRCCRGAAVAKDDLDLPDAPLHDRQGLDVAQARQLRRDADVGPKNRVCDEDFAARLAERQRAMQRLARQRAQQISSEESGASVDDASDGVHSFGSRDYAAATVAPWTVGESDSASDVE
ncbi:hypothetical protein NESM_000901900 [Novymonas esmeraldas]|uniref:Membrane-associated protein n=1 Tax=Novymonas esmeraldas TaxID=1808958 RepID=A0AAW0F259_9TRYP